MSVRGALAAVVLLLLVIAGCDSSDGDVATTAGPGDGTSAASSTTAAPTTSSPAGDGAGEPLTISQVLDTQPAGTVAAVGIFYDQGAGPLLCETLAESLPPQCAGRWLILSARPAAEIITEGGISWTDAPVVVTGILDGDVFVVEGTGAPEPTGPDIAVVDMLVAFARAEGDLASVSFAEEVQLGLGDMLVVSRTPAELADQGAWSLDLEPFRARTGPFSALEVLAEERPRVIIVGPHNHCASPPVPAPAGYEALRRVSVHPADATSCLEWFTVDLFMDDHGAIEAITLDLFEP